MSIRYYLLVSLLLSCSLGNLFSQQFQATEFRKDLTIKLDVVDEKRIDKGVDIINLAYEMERAAINDFEAMNEDDKPNRTSPEYKKVVKKLLESSEKYREGIMVIYTVFQENCVKKGELMNKKYSYATGLNKAKFYDRKAAKAYDRSLSIRDLVLMLERPELIQYKMAEALELEKLSIRDRGRALQIYQDFPVEYNYGWDDDVTPGQVEAAFKDPAISKPPDDLFVQKPISEIQPAQRKEPPIVFRVQIAAHTSPIELTYIKQNLYFGDLPVREALEDNWYKYSIGEFDNFNQANNLLKQIQVNKAFVVAYQEGKRLPIKDALAKIRLNQ
jgi:hypothetical protein